MRLFLIGLVSICLLFSSCWRKAAQMKEEEDVEITVYDTPAKDALNEEMKALTADSIKQAEEKINALKQKTKREKKLKRYNVIVATLSQQSGVDRLSRSFEKAGIFYFVVKDRMGYSMFIVGSSDSLEQAIEDRKEFLLQATLDKTRAQIWKDFDIEVTDSYIWERR